MIIIASSNEFSFWFDLCFCFSALEKLLKDHAGRYATGDEVFMVWFLFSHVFIYEIPFMQTFASLEGFH